MCIRDRVLADLRREAEHRERISALRSEAGRRGGRPRAESKTSNGLSHKADESNQSETESRKEKDRTQTKEMCIRDRITCMRCRARRARKCAC